MKEVLLSQGKIAVVDDEDFKAVSAFKWSAQRSKDTFYAVRHIYRPDGKRTQQGMHVFLMNPPAGMWVDHKNGNGLQNTRDNIRIATPTQNGANRKKVTGRSPFKGVCFRKRTDKWLARIRVAGRLIELGTFSDEVEAARVYDSAARKAFGAFASCNFEEGSNG